LHHEIEIGFRECSDENPSYKTGLCKCLKEGHTEVNRYKIRKTDFVKVPFLKAEKNSGNKVPSILNFGNS
jgi:hypothetical protein